MKWEKLTRASGLLEYVCEHGVGHPDYKSAKDLGEKTSQGESYGIHGCDGCCSREDFPGKCIKRDNKK